MAQSAFHEHNKLVEAITANIQNAFHRKRQQIIQTANNSEEQKRLLKRADKIVADMLALREDSEKLGYDVAFNTYANRFSCGVTASSSNNKLYQAQESAQQEAIAVLGDYSRELLLRQLSGEANALSGFTIPEKLKKLL